jgi:hypothetical protein
MATNKYFESVFCDEQLFELAHLHGLFCYVRRSMKLWCVRYGCYIFVV